VDDNDTGFHDLEKTFKNTGDEPKILLAHSPDIVDDLDKKNIPDLILSGHAHCGQIRLPVIGALPFIIPTKHGKSMNRHLYNLENTKIFVTCGVGEVGTRARLFNPPEVVVLKIND